MAKRMSGLDTMSVGDLQREIVRRSRSVRALMKRRDKVAGRLAALDRQIVMAGGRVSGRAAPASGGGRSRPQNDMSLVAALAQALKGKTMGIGEAADAVRKAGYQTNAANFRTMVNIALLKNKKLFKKVDRGQYSAA